MRIEYYDADTHLLVPKAATSDKLPPPVGRKTIWYHTSVVDEWLAQFATVERERDEARAEKEKAEFSARQFCSAHIGKKFLACPACELEELRAELSEIRHIVTETLPDLADQPDRETTVRRVAALATRYQYERDAAALLRKDVDRWEATSQAQAIEEHKLRAEVERLRGELDYRNEAPDAAVLRAEGTTLAKMTRDAVGDEPDAHALAVYGYVSKVDQFLTRLRAAPPIVTTATHVQIPRADYERVAHLLDGDAPPAVYLTDIEAAVKEWGDWEDSLTAILKKHTRPIDQTSPAVCAVDVKATARAVSRIIEGGDEGNFEGTVEAALYEHTRAVSVEEVARAIHEEAMRGDTWERVFSAARAALRAIGARLAQPVGRDPVGAERASLAAIKADAGKRLDAAKESMRAGGYLAAQPVEPKPEPAQLPVCARCGRFACGCEPAKVRVKLPPFSLAMHDAGYDGGWRGIYEAVCEEITKSLREQGVQVDDE